MATCAMCCIANRCVRVSIEMLNKDINYAAETVHPKHKEEEVFRSVTRGAWLTN